MSRPSAMGFLLSKLLALFLYPLGLE